MVSLWPGWKNKTHRGWKDGTKGSGLGREPCVESEQTGSPQGSLSEAQAEAARSFLFPLFISAT